LKRNNEKKAKLEFLKTQNIDEDDVCCVCLTNQRDIVTGPCGHTCLCETHFKEHYLSKPQEKRLCPLCNAEIENWVKQFVPKKDRKDEKSEI